MASGSQDGRADALFQSLLTPSLHAMAQEQLERIEGAFARLPERSREVLLLARVDGLAHADIAARMGLTEPHARVLLSRALARLAQALRVSESE
jgi:RNA polymerase sigma factor (sigma-70 family)